MLRLTRIDHVAMTVSDLERSVRWYQEVLGLERRYADAWEGPPIMLCAGETCLALFRTRTDHPEPPPDHETTAALWHLAFRVDRKNFERAQEEFSQQGIQFRLVDHGVCHSLYLSDPDGHRIELTTYEIGHRQ